MASLDDELLQEAEDDCRTVAFIRNYLPQELKEKITDDALFYFLDVMAEYYAESGILDATPDKDGCVEVDLEEVAQYLADKARKEKIGDFAAEDLLYVVEGEMEYAEQCGE